MSTQLAALALIGAINSARIRAAAPHNGSQRRDALAVFVVAMAIMTAAFAWWSGPILGGLDVSVPNARIAAGAGLLVVALRDLVAPAPAPTPGLPGRWCGLVPIAFPVGFTPATAALAIAIGADLGVARAVLVGTPALVVVAVVMLSSLPDRWLVWLGRSNGLFAAIVAVLTVLDGVSAV